MARVSGDGEVSRVRSAHEMVALLQDLIGIAQDSPDHERYEDLEGCTYRTFEEGMVLTRDKGLVVKLSNGAEFQLTVVVSQRPTEKNDDDDRMCPYCEEGIVNSFDQCPECKADLSEYDFEYEDHD